MQVSAPRLHGIVMRLLSIFVDMLFLLAVFAAPICEKLRSIPADECLRSRCLLLAAAAVRAVQNCHRFPLPSASRQGCLVLTLGLYRNRLFPRRNVSFAQMASNIRVAGCGRLAGKTQRTPSRRRWWRVRQNKLKVFRLRV